MIIQVFNRPEVKSGKVFDSDNMRQFVVEADVEDASTFEALAEILEEAYEQGVNRGSARSGICEIHTDQGIWTHVNARRIEVDTERKRKNVVFKSWEQMAWEEDQANLEAYLAKQGLLAAA